MMILRLAGYLFLLFAFLESLALSAVGWSFFESVNSSLALLKYTSDNKARDILSTVARVAESKMTPEGNLEMNDFFVRLIKQSEKDLDKFLIKEIYLISNDGILLAHSNPEELKIPDNTKFNKPQHMKALRMRKGQLPTPQVIGQDYKGDDSYFSNFITTQYPEVKQNTILLSAPVYHTERLEAVASIHLVYNRGNVLFFLENQREILTWMLRNYFLIALGATVLLWVIYTWFSFSSYKQGAKVATNIHRTSGFPTKNKISAMLEKHENTLQNYLTPIPARLDSDISLNIHAEEETEENLETVSESFNFGDEKKIEVKPSTNGKANTSSKDKNIQNPTEAIDAIYLD